MAIALISWMVAGITLARAIIKVAVPIISNAFSIATEIFGLDPSLNGLPIIAKLTAVMTEDIRNVPIAFSQGNRK